MAKAEAIHHYRIDLNVWGVTESCKGIAFGLGRSLFFLLLDFLLKLFGLLLLL
jgi:bacteriorhodopsin